MLYDPRDVYNPPAADSGGRYNSLTDVASEKERNYDRGLDQSSLLNLNAGWVNYKGAWSTAICVIIVLKILFSIIPGISREASWTLTNLSYNMGHFIMFHWVQGIPFEFNNQGAYDGMTLWEQIDNEIQFTATRKFLTALPIFLFLLSTYNTHYDAGTFLLNFTSLVIVLVAKLPAMHRVRVFGINKVDVD